MTRSYWQIKNESPGQKPRPDISVSCDIAVIGGGLLGIATAYFLRSFGCDSVIVLEKEFIGYGASGRNAGFIISGLAEPYSRLIVGMGNEWARLLMTSTLQNHDLIASAINDGNINCDYRRAGSYHFAVTDVELRELEDSVSLLHKDGFSGEMIEPEVIEDELGLDGFSGGYYCPADGCMDPFAFVNGLSNGIDVIQGFEVKSIRNSGGKLEIVGAGRSIDAEMAVLATNAYSAQLDGFFKELIFPVRGQMLAALGSSKSRLGTATCYANFGYDYFRQTPDNSILMGGLRDKFIETEIGLEDEINPGLQEGLEDYIRARLGVEHCEILCRWSGPMANTIDGLPLVGSLPHNSSVIAAVGCNGHGFGLGMIIARDVARAIMKNETSELLGRFSLKRFAR